MMEAPRWTLGSEATPVRAKLARELVLRISSFPILCSCFHVRDGTSVRWGDGGKKGMDVTRARRQFQGNVVHFWAALWSLVTSVGWDLSTT